MHHEPSSVITERGPRPRSLLPFRVEAGASRGHSTTVIHYEGECMLPDGTRKRLPFRKEVMAQPGDPSLIIADPLIAAILAMMKAYYELEERIDPLNQEREELALAQAALEARCRSLEGQVEELKHRVTDGGNGKRGRRDG